MGNQKWQKKLNLKNWKSTKMAKYQGLGVLTFQIQIFLSFLVSHQKTILFFKANILLFYQKKFEVDSIDREENIL